VVRDDRSTWGDCLFALCNLWPTDENIMAEN
jgi:hypothetical protein